MIETGRIDARNPEATAPQKSRRRWLRLGIAALLLSCLAAVAVVAALYWSASLLTVEHEAATADVIVLLGGEPTYRPPRVVELYEQRLATGVIVSGNGDGADVIRWLAAKKIPEAVIRIEPSSVNTRQNAKFTVPLLREQKTRRVIIVTSWFHSRRALACFQKAAPEIEFISLPTIADRPKSHWPNKEERKTVLREYLKLGWYWVRYGVWPL